MNVFQAPATITTVEQTTDNGSGDSTDFLVTTSGELPPGTFITKKCLAKLMGRHEVSIERAVKRGELPPPARLCGAATWTCGVILEHLEKRLAEAAKEAERDQRRVAALHP